MKKIIRKVKGKKVLSFVLAAIMLATTFNIALPELKLNASAVDLPRDAEGNVVLDGITQKRVVGTDGSYVNTYAKYANQFFGGDGKSEPTNFVIPGLSSSDDYTPQGMTYWKAKDWILISAYDAGGSDNSVIYALDGKTTNFVALFRVFNNDGSVNTSHGGGIAASEYNFYYADKGSKISYVPLSEMDVAPGTVKEIKLKGSIDCKGELNGAATSYCCYDEGVLWTGNFYLKNDNYDYGQPANTSYNSMLFGYKLQGNSSEEEWFHLQDKNLINPDKTGDLSYARPPYGTLNYNVSLDDSGYIDITGNIVHDEAQGTCGEYAPSFATVYLTHGTTYKLEFDLTTPTMAGITDFYFLRDGGTGSYTNIGFSVGGSTKVTDNGDGTYHYETTLTPGEPIRNASGTRAMDGNWDNVADASGNYSLRFDQDNVSADKAVSITNIHIYQVSAGCENVEENGRGCEGNPTYCIAFDNAIDKIQYAMVDNGRIYISRSWSRKEGSTHVRQLAVGEIDLNSRGTAPLTINGRTRYCQLVSPSANNYTTFGGGSGSTDMFYMGEALCVMEGYLYMFAESAAYTYRAKTSDNVCPEPIDVIWKIDQFAIMGELRETDNEKLSYYKPVKELSEINKTEIAKYNTDEYIIVYESSQKDPVTQKNILYALDAFGGHNDNKLPKNSDGSLGENLNGYSIGVVGHPITEYNIEDGNLYLTNPEKDDIESIRWKFSGAEHGGVYTIQSVSPYYANYKELYFNGVQTFMSKNASKVMWVLKSDAPDEKWYIDICGTYKLWCNDGAQGYDNAINSYYQNQGCNFTEQPGTFHSDGDNKLNGNVINAKIKDDTHGQFYIYKRILDKHAEKENSKVYTNSTATLQPDGTYTIDMETYAIGATHYTILDEPRPTDFIFVLDASGSMTNKQDARGYHTQDKGWTAMSMKQAAGDNDDIAENGNYNQEWTSNFYYKLPDGEFARISVAVNKGSDGKYSRDIWLWCKHPVTGRCYKISQKGYLVVNNCTGNPATDSSSMLTDEMFLANPSGYGYASASEILSEASSDKNRTDYHSKRDSKNSRRSYEVLEKEYTVDGVTRNTYYNAYGNCSRLCGMQQAVEKLSFKIAEEAAETGLEHRVALVTYGSDGGNESWLNTGMYTGNTWNQFNGSLSASVYQKAFYNLSDFASFRRVLYGIQTEIDDPDTYSNYGYEMAKNIVSNYSGGYLADGNRSACVIMITDGIPGLGENKLDVAKTVGDQAIDQAYKVKQKGAYCFSIQIGNNTVWGNMDAYMDYVSSEFIEANSLTDSGERNPNDVTYRIDIPTGTEFNIDNLVNTMFEEIASNSTMALTQLDEKSILRQTLSDNFYAPVNGANVQFLFADGYYDGLGRLAFRNESDATQSGVTGTPTTATDSEGNQYYKYLDVTGFDYKDYYISKTHEGGKKLIVRITGVLPRTTSVTDGSEISHINSSISDDSWTGIYQTETMLKNKQEFKGFPNESFSIPEYTYVLDYGLQILDTDVNGTLCSVSDTLSKQDPNVYNKVSKNGAVAIQSGDQNLLYSLSPDKTEESGYTLIKRDDGTYDWFKINVVPASNVYYEETKMKDGASGKVAWSTEGSQDTENRVLPGVDDPYGWDNAYDKTSPYSNGTALYAKLNSSNKNTSTKTFKFTGTGIDIVSACGRSTGVIVVNIKDSSGKRVKGYIVDTYYENGAFNGSKLVSQVPVVSWSGTHGTYTVDVAAMYLSSAGAVQETIPKSGLKNKLINTGIVMNSGKPVNNDSAAEMLKNAGLEEFIAEDMEFVWFDDNSVLNGGTGVEPTKKGSRGSDPGTATLHNYIDGFRVYNPLGKNADTSGIYPETEKKAVYANVINNLAKLEDPNNPTNLTADGIAYVTTQPNGVLTFANYESIGPKNELYLNGGGTKSVSFAVKVSPNEKLMLGLRAVNGKTKFTVTSDNSDYSVKNVEVNSATEMYYDITACLGTLSETKEVKITITNSGDNILALNHLKFSGIDTANSAIPSVRSAARSGDAATDVVTNKFFPVTQEDLLKMQAILEKPGVPGIVKNGVVIPLVEENEELPGGDNNEGDVSQDPDNGNSGVGDGSDSSENIFDIFSLLKGLIEFIRRILFATVGNESLF